MNYFSSLYVSYVNEFKKEKNSPALWLSLLAPASVVFLFFCIYFFRWEAFIPKEGENIWNKYMFQGLFNVAGLLLPLFVILLTALLANLEHKENTWKQINILPFPSSGIHFGKLLNLLSFLAITMLGFIIFLSISGWLLWFLRPGLKFNEHSFDYFSLLSNSVNLFFACLGMMIIQYWLSMRFKNFIVPLGFGLSAFIFANVLIRGWDEIIYFPYAFTTLSLMKHYGESNLQETILGMPIIIFNSLTYFTVGAIISYFDIRRIEVK